MSTKADHIRWLAELSAERRALRQQGMSAAAAIWAQINGPTTIRYSVEGSYEARTKRPSAQKKRVLRATLLTVQGPHCYICIAAGKPEGLARFGAGALRPVLEHVVPISRGGVNRQNLALAHDVCDRRKGDRLPTRAELFALACINAGQPPISMSGFTESTTIGKGSRCRMVTTASLQSVDGKPITSYVPENSGSG